MLDFDDCTDQEIADEVTRYLTAEYREIGKLTLRALLEQVKIRVLDKDPVPADVLEPTAV